MIKPRPWLLQKRKQRHACKKTAAGGGGGAATAIVNHSILADQSNGFSGATVNLGFTPTAGNYLIAFFANNGGQPTTVRSGWTKIAQDNAAQDDTSYVGGAMAYRVVQGGDTATVANPFPASPTPFPPNVIFFWEISTGKANFAALKAAAQYWENNSIGQVNPTSLTSSGTFANDVLVLYAVFRRATLDPSICNPPAGFTIDDSVVYAGSRGFKSAHKAQAAGAYSFVPTVSNESNYTSTAMLALN